MLLYRKSGYAGRAREAGRGNQACSELHRLERSVGESHSRFCCMQKIEVEREMPWQMVMAEDGG